MNKPVVFIYDFQTSLYDLTFTDLNSTLQVKYTCRWLFDGYPENLAFSNSIPLKTILKDHYLYFKITSLC